MSPLARRTVCIRAWVSPGEHSALSWLANAMDRTMSGVVRLLVLREKRFLLGQYRDCPMCGAALSTHDGAVIVKKQDE